MSQLDMGYPILDSDTVETLSARILEQEHRIYTEAINLVLAGNWHLEGRRFLLTSSANAGPAKVRVH